MKLVKTIAMLSATLALAGCGMLKDKMPGGGSSASGISKPEKPAALECNDDKGVEQLGKDMDAKAFDGMIAAQTALAHMYDAAGKKPDAEKTRAQIKEWQGNKEKAPSGLDRIRTLQATSDNIQKGAEFVSSQNKTDDATKTALKQARWELRRSLVYIAWGSKIGKPVPEKAKEAISASAGCSKKVKPAADAAAGLTTLSTNLKKSYDAVDGAAKKAGNAEMTDAEKKQQISETGAPSDLTI